MGPFEYILLSLVILALVALIILIILVLRPKEVKVEQKADLTMHEKMIELRNQIDSLNKDVTNNLRVTLLEHSNNEQKSGTENSKKLSEEINQKLAQVNKVVTEALEGANKTQLDTLTKLGSELEALKTANNQVSKLGEDVSVLTQVITGNNQKRGQFGEFLLKSILDNIFETTPEMFSTQYDLNVKGEKVRPDAVLFLPKEKGHLLCIDAKFPYANYLSIFNEDGSENENKVKEFKDDVKKKIDEISKKYIVSGMTTDYALCYFPSDEIYNYVNTKLHDVAELARKKSVILVSPATLQPVLHTLRALMIEYKRSQNLQALNQLIQSLGKDFVLLRDRWEKINNSLRTLTNHIGDFDKTFTRLDSKFERISEAAEIEED